MFSIKVNENNDKYLKLSWNNNICANNYIIEGKNNFFNFELIDKIEDNSYLLDKKLIDKYYGFRVLSLMNDSIIDTSLEYNFKDIKIEKNYNVIISSLKVKCIESFNGVTFSLNTKNICDIYRLYEINNESKKLLLESSDFIFSYKSYSLDKDYIIEGFKYINDSLEKVGKTESFKINFEKIDNSSNKLSICIPAYNAEAFISRTIDSVLANDFDGYKIIICNDGSKDSTKDVCTWYANKYDFIKFIDKENTGVSDTRNVLLDNVDTPYMAYLDADDFVTNDYYKKLYDVIVMEDADICLSKTIIRDEKEDRRKVLLVDCGEKGYKNYDFKSMFIENEKNSYDNIYFVAVWNKIVKTDIAKKVRFPKGDYYEDSAYTPTLYSYANKFVIVDNIYYIWDKRKRLTHGTYSTSYNQISFENIVKNYSDAISYPIYNCNIHRHEYIDYMCVKLLLSYYSSIRNNNSYVVKDYLDNLKRIIHKKQILKNKLVIENKNIINDINNL